MSLPDLQHHMMGFLLDEASGTPAISAGHLENLEAIISDASPAEGLQIYSHAYRARLIEVLGNDHEKLKQFLGAEEFTRLAGLFVAGNPSKVRSLRYYGENFPEFLTTSDHPEAQLAGELCAFERTLLDAYDAPFGEQPIATALQAVAPDAWPSMTLQPHPSVRVFTDQTRAIPMWQHCNRSASQQAPVAPLTSEPTADDPATNDDAAQPWVLWRNRERVCQFRHLATTEHLALHSMLIENRDLATTAEELMPHVAAEQLAPSLQQWLSQWLTDGLIQSIQTN